MRLLDGLRNFEISTVKGETSRKAKQGIAQLTKAMGGATGPELVQALKKSSQSAAGLYKWASATDKYYDIFRTVEPKKKLAEDMQRKSNRATEELNATLAALAQVTEQLKELNKAQKVKQDELDILLRRQAEMARKLNAASKLITGLESEKTRWTQQN